MSAVGIAAEEPSDELEVTGDPNFHPSHNYLRKLEFGTRRIKISGIESSGLNRSACALSRYPPSFLNGCTVSRCSLFCTDEYIFRRVPLLI